MVREVAENKRPDQASDRAIALKLWLHRRLDRLFDEVLAPDWTGNVSISFSVKEGRPGMPRITPERYGVHEL